MTQAQLDRAVAGATGESLRTIRRLGFGLRPPRRDDLEPEDLRLVVDCPFCGRPVAYPGPARDGSPALAECAALRRLLRLRRPPRSTPPTAGPRAGRARPAAVRDRSPASRPDHRPTHSRGDLDP